MTMEWTDGIISTIVREACNAVAEGDTAKKWICCDGPVDAIWIESMNTVSFFMRINFLICSGQLTRVSRLVVFGDISCFIGDSI